MSEFEIAQHVLNTLRQAESAEPQAAVPLLKKLIRLVNGDGTEQPFEVEEARSTAFMAICEYAKALHRGQPAEELWPEAIHATKKWQSLAGSPALA
jgi:hypothetical protein